MAKIYVAMTSNGFVKALTNLSLFQLALDCPHELTLGMKVSCDVVGNRNWIVQDALDKGFTHVLFVDSDMAFSPELLTILLNQNKDIIGVSTNFRHFPIETTVKFFKDQDPVLPKETFECDAVGTGLMLLKTDVLKKLNKPYFFFEYDENGQMKTGEDVYFCRKAREAGFKIWCDPTVEVGHVGDYIF